MAVEATFQAFRIPTILAVGALFALAAAVLIHSIRNRVHVAFALVVLVRGVELSFFAARDLSAGWDGAFERAALATMILVPLAVLNFLHAFWRGHRRSKLDRAVPWTLLVLGVVLVAWYLSGPRYTYLGIEDGVFFLGPLETLAYAAAAAVMLVGALREHKAVTRRRSGFLASVGFGVGAAYLAAF